MSKLADVSKAEAAKFLAEVEFGRHLQGTRSTPMSGGLPVIITSLQEAEEFLYVGASDGLKIIGGRGIVSYLDLHKLSQWIGEVIGDVELAQAVTEAVAAGTCYADRIGPVKALLAERVQQCRVSLETE